MIFILNNTNENNSKKMKVELWFLFSAHCLIKLYICNKFHENILHCIKLTEWTRFSFAKITK